MCQGLGPKKHDEISEIDHAVEKVLSDKDPVGGSYEGICVKLPDR